MLTSIKKLLAIVIWILLIVAVGFAITWIFKIIFNLDYHLKFASLTEVQIVYKPPTKSLIEARAMFYENMSIIRMFMMGVVAMVLSQIARKMGNFVMLNLLRNTSH